MSLTESPSKQRRELIRDNKGQVVTGFSDEIAATICERLSAGEHLSHICASDNMPSGSAFHRWMNARPSLRDDYRRAREAQAQHWAHQVVEIADELGTGSAPVSSEAINLARLRVDARKWVASKLIPRVYGDRVQTEVGRPGEFEAIDSARLLAEQIAQRLGSPKLIEAQAVDITED